MTSSSLRPSLRSKESLSEKLSIGPSNNGEKDNRKKSTRKRNSLASETSHTSSTAASSYAGTPSLSTDSTPLSPRQRAANRNSLDNSAATAPPRSSSSSDPKNERRSAASSTRGSRRRRSSVTQDPTVVEEEKKKETEENSNNNNSLHSVNGTAHEAWEEKIREVQAAAASSSSADRNNNKEERQSSKRESRTRRSSTSKGAEAAMASTSSRSSSRRRSKSATKLSAAAADQAASPSTSRRVSSKSNSGMKTKKKSSSSSTKSKRGKSGERSLTSFMKNEISSRPPETEEMLEVRSAYTSLSRSRNRNKNPLGSSSSGGLHLSFHGGESAVRNTRTYREMTRSRSSSRTRTNVVNNGNANNNLHDSFNSSGSFHYDEDETDVASFGAHSGAHSEGGGRSFRRSLSDDPQQWAGLKNNLTPHQHHGSQHQFRQSFASLPVLPEESKKQKKSSSKSSSRKSKKASGSISPQELSDFLEQCNAKRKKKEQEEAAATAAAGLGSPISGDRSCVSMPANFAKERKPRKTSSTSASPKKNGTTASASASVKPPPLSKSQRSFRTSSSSSDPNQQPLSSKKPAKGPPAEKSTDKEDRGGRARSSRRTSSNRQQRGSTGTTRTSTKDDKSPKTRDELSESMQEAARQRSKSAHKGYARKKDKAEDSRTRSLSRSRNGNESDMNSSSRRSEHDLEGSSRHQSSDARRERPKSFQKLFSIRDLAQGDADQPNGHSETLNVDSQYKTPVAMHRGSLGSGSLGDADLTLTPPPPLTPYSPYNSAHSREGGYEATGGTSKKKLNELARFRRASNSSQGQHLYGATTMDDSEENIQSSPATPTRQPVSILKNKGDIQASGDNTEEAGTPRHLDLRLDADEILDFEAELDFAEDVFSHYTWCSDDMASIDALEATKPERDRLKSLIRESHLYSAFETLEDWF